MKVLRVVLSGGQVARDDGDGRDGDRRNHGTGLGAAHDPQEAHGLRLCATTNPSSHSLWALVDHLRKIHFDQIAIPLPLLCRPFIDIVLDRGAWLCAGNELVQSTREAIFGTTTNAALRLTEEDAEDW